jgi:hypothetical protein
MRGFAGLVVVAVAQPSRPSAPHSSTVEVS